MVTVVAVLVGTAVKQALLSMSRRRLDFLRNTKIRLNKQSEDCLNLNIYIPHEAARQQKGDP